MWRINRCRYNCVRLHTNILLQKWTPFGSISLSRTQHSDIFLVRPLSTSSLYAKGVFFSLDHTQGHKHTRKNSPGRSIGPSHLTTNNNYKRQRAMTQRESNLQPHKQAAMGIGHSDINKHINVAQRFPKCARRIASDRRSVHKENVDTLV